MPTSRQDVRNMCQWALASLDAKPGSLREGQAAMRRADDVRRTSKTVRQPRTKGSLRGKRNGVEDDPMMQDPARVILDGQSRTRGYAEFRPGRVRHRPGEFVEVYPPSPHVLDRVVRNPGKNPTPGMCARVRYVPIWDKSGRPTGRFFDLETRRVLEERPPHPLIEVAQFIDEVGPTGMDYVRMGKGEAVGTDRPQYSRDSLQRQGVSVMDEDGFPRSSHQSHDDRRNEKHTTHLRD